VPPGGRAEAFARPERPAGQRPESLVWRRAALPEQGMQTPAAYLQDHGKRLVPEPCVPLADGGSGGNGGLRPMFWHVWMILWPETSFRL
jgi:hypothetical protein